MLIWLVQSLGFDPPIKCKKKGVAAPPYNHTVLEVKVEDQKLKVVLDYKVSSRTTGIRETLPRKQSKIPSSLKLVIFLCV